MFAFIFAICFIYFGYGTAFNLRIKSKYSFKLKIINYEYHEILNEEKNLPKETDKHKKIENEKQIINKLKVLYKKVYEKASKEMQKAGEEINEAFEMKKKIENYEKEHNTFYENEKEQKRIDKRNKAIATDPDPNYIGSYTYEQLVVDYYKKNPHLNPADDPYHLEIYRKYIKHDP